MPTGEVTYTKELNDYDEESGECARVSGLELNTVPLCPVQWGPSTMKQGSSSEASKADETNSSVRIRRTPTVSLTNHDTPSKMSPTPEDKSDSKRRGEGMKAL